MIRREESCRCVGRERQPRLVDRGDVSVVLRARGQLEIALAARQAIAELLQHWRFSGVKQRIERRPVDKRHRPLASIGRGLVFDQVVEHSRDPDLGRGGIGHANVSALMIANADVDQIGLRDKGRLELAAEHERGDARGHVTVVYAAAQATPGPYLAAAVDRIHIEADVGAGLFDEPGVEEVAVRRIAHPDLLHQREPAAALDVPGKRPVESGRKQAVDANRVDVERRRALDPGRVLRGVVRLGLTGNTRAARRRS